MRRSLPYDAAICLCVAALIAWGVGILAGKVAESSWERQKEELAPKSGEVGGIAGKEVFRVQTVEDMLSHDTFTIEYAVYRTGSAVRGRRYDPAGGAGRV